MIKNSLIYRIVAVAMFLLVSGASLYAQHNSFDIDDRLYELYLEGADNNSDEKAIVIADSLMAEGIRVGEYRAVCLSYELRIRYLHQQRFTIDTVRYEVNQMKRYARSVGLPQYYYYASLLEVQKLLTVSDDIDAMHILSKMQEEAEAEELAFAKYLCHLTMGDIYANRRNFTMAVQEYNAAKDLVLNSQIDRSPVTALHNCARCQIELGQYEEALQNVDLVVNNGHVSPVLLIRLQCIKCIAEFRLGKVDEFRESYREYKKYSSATHDVEGIERRVVMMALLADGDVRGAISYVRSYTTGALQSSLLAYVYHYSGDDKTAYGYLKQTREQLLELFDKSFSRDIDKFNSTIEHDKLRQQAKDLELEKNHYEIMNNELEQQRNKLRLENAQLELDHQQAALSLQKSQVEKRDLELRNRNLQIAQQQLDQQRQQEEHEREQRMISRNESVWMLVAGFAFLFVIIGIVYFSLRERDFRKLAKLNSNLHEAQMQAEDNQRKAEESEYQKTLFIQSMSHEIRTPLNAICGFSQILADNDIRHSLSVEERERIGDVISDNTEKLITIVNDILYISDIKSGKYKMSLQEVSAVDICKNALASVIDHKSESVELNFATNLKADFKIVTDANRVQQVLENLLSNAIKHTSSGEICLYCVEHEKYPDGVVFAVNDTGEGVPADKAEAIFDSFTKLNEFKQGTGLGLAICRLIAEKLGGKVYLDTDYKEGASFVFAHPKVAVVPHESIEEGGDKL